MSTLCFNNSRDVELLSSLVMGPLTTAQLQKLSPIFAEGPFQSPRTLLDRLHRLAAGGFVRRFPLAIVSARGGGLPYYYKLTPAGLRLLYGDNIQAPSKKFFAPIAIARHHHTHSLSDFLVTTAVAAKRHGFRLADIHPENTLVLDINGEQLIPDTRFDLLGPEAGYRFFIEHDCSTETIHSTKHDDTIHRKLRLYDVNQDVSGDRHRVLFVTARSRERLTNSLDAAAAVVRNPQRTLFLGVYLPDYLAAADPVGELLFLDHRGRRHGLVPLSRSAATSSTKLC